MTTEIKKVLERKLVESKGFLFGKFNHNGVKSAKGNKLHSFGLQFVKGNFDENMVLSLGCKHCDDNTDKSAAAMIDTTSTEVTVKAGNDIGSLMKSDDIAIGISRVLGMKDNEGCDMHDGNNIGCAEMCRLTSSDNKVITNAFEDCQKLLKKYRKFRKHFS